MRPSAVYNNIENPSFSPSRPQPTSSTSDVSTYLSIPEMESYTSNVPHPVPIYTSRSHSDRAYSPTPRNTTDPRNNSDTDAVIINCNYNRSNDEESGCQYSMDYFENMVAELLYTDSESCCGDSEIELQQNHYNYNAAAAASQQQTQLHRQCLQANLPTNYATASNSYSAIPVQPRVAFPSTDSTNNYYDGGYSGYSQPQPMSSIGTMPMSHGRLIRGRSATATATATPFYSSTCSSASPTPPFRHSPFSESSNSNSNISEPSQSSNSSPVPFSTDFVSSSPSAGSTNSSDNDFYFNSGHSTYSSSSSEYPSNFYDDNVNRGRFNPHPFPQPASFNDQHRHRSRLFMSKPQASKLKSSPASTTTERPNSKPENQKFLYTLTKIRARLCRLRPLGKKLCCKFCQNNKECPEVYNTHVLNDEQGRVICPLLQKYICQLCGATGYNAHTVKYCPLKEFNIEDAMDRMLLED